MNCTDISAELWWNNLSYDHTYSSQI